MLFRELTDLIGNTPLFALDRMVVKRGLKAEIYAKLEGMNPAGSVKDRAAAKMIADAEADGRLVSGATIIEPTSGNTGIGLASIAAARGYRVILTMPDTMSVERRKLLAAYGAEIVLTEGALGMAGAIEKAHELAEKTENSFIPGQFDNPSNVAAHYETTGPEIWDATEGNVDIFVAGVGTGGTLTGIGKYLKEKKPDIKIVAVEPQDSQVLSGGAAGAHKLQGIGAGFVPEILDTDIIDEIMCITTEESFASARALAREEGVLVGISSGAALSAAIKLAGREEHTGKKIVVLLPDIGDRYLSTPLFE